VRGPDERQPDGLARPSTFRSRRTFAPPLARFSCATTSAAAAEPVGGFLFFLADHRRSRVRAWGRARRSAAPEQHRLNEPVKPLPVRSEQRVPLRVVELGARGRGVVAERAIARGELIERSPVIIIPEQERAAVDPTNVGNYIFLWEHGTTGEDIYSRTGRAAVALGYTSLVNHSDDPNCEFVRHIDELALDLYARRAIAPGEELTFDYDMTLWFTPE